MMVPAWFLYLGGFSLIILGGLQLQARPRDGAQRGLERFLNLGTAWSAVCITVGGLLLAMATGWWTPDVLKPLPKKPPIRQLK